jgi:hypothetical protein
MRVMFSPAFAENVVHGATEANQGSHVQTDRLRG